MIRALYAALLAALVLFAPAASAESRWPAGAGSAERLILHGFHNESSATAGECFRSDNYGGGGAACTDANIATAPFNFTITRFTLSVGNLDFAANEACDITILNGATNEASSLIKAGDTDPATLTTHTGAGSYVSVDGLSISVSAGDLFGVEYNNPATQECAGGTPNCTCAAAVFDSDWWIWGTID